LRLNFGEKKAKLRRTEMEIELFMQKRTMFNADQYGSIQINTDQYRSIEISLLYFCPCRLIHTV